MSFLWPPGAEESRDGGESPALAHEAPAGARVGVWRSVERTWLAETRPPLIERLTDWRPDEPSAFCPRCATGVGAFEADADGCAACRAKRLAWRGAVRLGAHAGVLRDVIHEIKFDRDRHAAEVIGELLGEALVARLLAAGRNPAMATIVPVPSTFRRRVHRGIDHSMALARSAARVGSMTLSRALVRRHRPSQVSLAMSERRRNVAGSMRPRRGERLRGLVVVLDDVRTTGATMTEASRTVARGGADEVWACVAAVTERQ